MAALTIQDIVPAGLVVAYAAANASETIKIDGDQRVFLHVKNGGGGSINVTITAVKTSVSVPDVGQLTVSNHVVAVAAAAEKMIGPFTRAFVDASGNVAVAYSGTTSVTAAAIRAKAPV